MGTVEVTAAGTGKAGGGAILNPDSCAHRQTEVRRRLNSAGGKMYRRQCLDCGSGVGEWIKSATIPRIWEIRDWDAVLEAAGDGERSRSWQERAQSFQSEREARNNEWWEKYNEYLRSPEWAARRAKVLHRDKHVCQACRINPATQAHHLTYAHVFNEPLFDLVAICEPCHRTLTEMDRASRVA